MSDENSLNDKVTFAGQAKQPRADLSYGDDPTLGRGDAVGIDTSLDHLEVVDLEARYRIECTLGQGGMGAVMLATDTRLDRKVAIKRILGAAARSKAAIMRFLTEAKAIAALNHPNVVQIHDYGQAKDGPFLIMEYVDGGSLADRCKEGGLQPEEAVDLACQLCDGLAKAHDAGIVHRDIKPANVLLTKDGHPKLSDFGLAKAKANDHGITRPGVGGMGTPDFMPPEQRRDASEVDHRSDLWSLAATVYQMVTGRSPKVIRLHELPHSLQPVLSKALEDRKDARYQSAREFRDALKSALRAEPVAVGEDLVEGKCPACGVKNDTNRKFCRACAESLVAPCLGCSEPMAMWDEVCGSCGAKQTPLVEERRQAMAASQAEAEGLLGDCEFDRACAIAKQHRNVTHPKLQHFRSWAEPFLEQVATSRAQRTRHAVEAILEARKHEAAYDYVSAEFTLETVPESMRDSTLPGATESAASALARIRKTEGQVRRLEAILKQRIANKSYDGLLPEVEKLLALCPAREDIKTLRKQLIDRQEKQKAAHAAAAARAEACLAAHDYEGALAALESFTAQTVTTAVIELRKHARDLKRRSDALAQQIKAAVAEEQLDGLLGTVEKYLEFKPADREMNRVRQSLIEREEKFAADIAYRLYEARQLEQECCFDKAAAALEQIPEIRRSKVVANQLERCQWLAQMKSRVLEEVSVIPDSGDLNGLSETGLAKIVEFGRAYLAKIAAHGLSDPAIEGQLSRCAFAHAALEAARETAREVIATRRRVFFGSVVALGLLAFLVVVSGVWIRSSMRMSSMNAAIRAGRWDEALVIDPENVSALLGRARQRLSGTPADIEAAFADLDIAARTGRDAASVQTTRGDAYAARSIDHASNGKLTEATKDLAEAQRAPASAGWIDRATATIASEWLKRADGALNKGDISHLTQAVAAAKAAGAANGTLLAMWREYARQRIDVLDAKGVEIACSEGRKFGLVPTDEAEWWLEIGQLGVARGDHSVVQVAANAAKAAGVANEKLLAMWRQYAERRAAVLDYKGLSMALSEGGRFGLTQKEEAGWWLEVARFCVKRGDQAAVKTAVDRAKAAGAEYGALRAIWREYARERIDVLDAQGLEFAYSEGKKFGLLEHEEAEWWLEKARLGLKRGDQAAVQTAVRGAKAAGASDGTLLAIWREYARMRIDGLDTTGLQIACSEGKNFGLTKNEAADWWLEISQLGAARGGLVAVQIAAQAANFVGEAETIDSQPESRFLMIEALSLTAQKDMPGAASAAFNALLVDASVAATVLQRPSNALLREVVAAECRSRFDAAMARKNWPEALRIVGIAKSFDKTSESWVSHAFASLPMATLASMQPTVLAVLPPAVWASRPPLRNSIGMDLRFIPAGTFTMGDKHQTAREVTLTKPFFIGVYEVTNAQWKQVMGTTPSKWKDDDRPVEQVSWDDADDFCTKLSALPDERKAGRVYRLPTEAEWEYACRAGTTTTYSFGDDIGLLHEYGWHGKNSARQTHPVGQKKPNPWGLYDMHGNVSEWCSDWYDEYRKGPAKDPQGPSRGSEASWRKPSKVYRGSDWNDAYGLGAAYRGFDSQASKERIGFRLALSLPEVQQPAGGDK